MSDFGIATGCIMISTPCIIECSEKKKNAVKSIKKRINLTASVAQNFKCKLRSFVF